MVEVEVDETLIVGERFVNQSEEGEIITHSGKIPGLDGSFKFGK